MLLKESLNEQFGHIDIYLFDQILKGRFDGCKRVLDAGCGTGRNLVFFFRQGLDVYGVDRDAGAIKGVKERAAQLAPHLPPDNFQIASLEALSFSDHYFDAIVCNAVFHFAEDENHFSRMLDELWRVLKPGGFLFTRLASAIGIESLVPPALPKEHRRFMLPDGSERFLVDEKMLTGAAERLCAETPAPIKTTIVGNLRCMTTWCLRKK
ncbi:MAG: class I SAM-dependent methyltransferase [bacterium]|nr:class I SAM-dependent methyltransferase [bacterium]